MALTITEQMNMIKGTAKPPSNDLGDLIHQSAMRYSYDFFSNYKVFATLDNATPPNQINVGADNYVRKIMGVCSSVFRADQSVVNSLKRIIVTIIGASTI